MEDTQYLQMETEQQKLQEITSYEAKEYVFFFPERSSEKGFHLPLNIPYNK